MEFNLSYTEYWQSAVNRSVDGIQIAGASQVEFFLDQIAIGREHNVLDLGCSYGRLFPSLNKYSDFIYGADPEIGAVSQAARAGYIDAQIGQAENTNFPSEFFDFILSWAVFDVVDHTAALKEMNRLLKVDGVAIFTGKNADYFSDDELGYVAEKNAFLKDFPNHFTKLNDLRTCISSFGFKFIQLYLCPKRGDLGRNVWEVVDLASNNMLTSYEYIAIIRKVDEVKKTSQQMEIPLDQPHSNTAISLSREKNFENVFELFNAEGLN